MKRTVNRLFVLSLVLASAAFAVAQDKSHLTIKYDKKKDETSVRLKQFRIAPLILDNESRTSMPLHQTELEVSYTYPGQTATGPVSDATFRFHVSASNYVFLKAQTAIVVLDNEGGQGRAFALGTSDYKSRLEFNSVYLETFTVTAPAEALERIGKAKSLQIYLGPVGYSITDKQLELLKELAASLPAKTPATKN